MPSNLAALGADLVDKSQSLSLKAVRNLASLPLVAVDLYGEGGNVAIFPPRSLSSGGKDGGGGGEGEGYDGPMEGYDGHGPAVHFGGRRIPQGDS